MSEIKINFEQFDLMGFIKVIFDFLRLMKISPEAVVYFSEDGDPLELEGDRINQDYIQELLFQGKILFFPFSDINVGEPIPCADGGQYLISDSDGFDEEVAVSVNGIESVGFLVQVEQEMITICPAVFRGGEYETINATEMEGELKEFSEPMDKFVFGFVKN
jgi:hypothetical protein